jgi:tetratricopeptide (TPR) repeat protein
MNATRIGDGITPTGRTPLRETLGVAAFGVNAWTKDAGEQLVGEHNEARSGHEELYVVVDGRATFTVDGEERDAPAGTAVLVAPASKRGAVAAEDGTTVLVVGRRPDGLYRPRSYETNGKVIRLFGEGRYEEAGELLRAALGKYEDEETIEYNLACCEARLGHGDAAFEHLRRGLEGRSDLHELAREDEDLVSLRDDARFAELVGAPTPTPG